MLICRANRMPASLPSEAPARNPLFAPGSPRPRAPRPAPQRAGALGPALRQYAHVVMKITDRLSEMRAKAAIGGGEQRIAQQHAKGKLTARERIDLVLDEW